MKKKRKFTAVIIAAAIAVTTAFMGCGNNDETAKDTKQDSYVFKIGTANGSLCLAPLHVAEDLGYFEDEFKEAGLKYELVEIDIQQAADLVASGKIDACVGLAGSLIPQVDSGLDIAFTAGLHTGCTKYYTKPGSGITDVSQLKGKKIGVPGMSDSSVIQLKRKLADAGIGVSTDNMEVELAAYNMTDLPLALENGAVDAIGVHDPVAASGEQEYGFTKILDLTEDEKFASEYCCAVYVTTTAAKEHPEASAAYTKALMKASAYVQAKPEDAAKLQIENDQCSGELSANTALLRSYNYSPSVDLMEQTFFNACTDLLEIGDLQEGRDIDEFTAQHTAKFDGVPDSYVYNEDGTFTETDNVVLNAGSKKKETDESNSKKDSVITETNNVVSGGELNEEKSDCCS